MRMRIHFTSSFCRVQEELVAADELCGPMLAGDAPPDWGALMQPFPFFTAFKNYLQVGTCGALEEKGRQGMGEWVGRRLVAHNSIPHLVFTNFFIYDALTRSIVEQVTECENWCMPEFPFRPSSVPPAGRGAC